MWSTIFTHKKRGIYVTILILTNIVGLQSAMAYSYAPLQKSSYFSLPLLLAAYHLILFLSDKEYIPHLKFAALAIAVTTGFSQPHEIYHLLWQTQAYEQNLGFIILLIAPVFLLFSEHFFKNNTPKRLPNHLFWVLIGMYVITVATHFLRFYTSYFSLTFLICITLFIGVRLVYSFAQHTRGHYFFVAGLLVWLSIFIVNGVSSVTHYYEIPLTVMLLAFSGATLRQQNEKVKTGHTARVDDLSQQVDTREQTIHTQQKVIHEKDRMIKLKEKRLQTSKDVLEKAGRKLKEKERVLKLQNQQITKSIEYARNIQEAILPTEQALRQFFRDYFVLYQPKDIVSGDFYWCSQVTMEQPPTSTIAKFVYQTSKQYTFLAAIDCTGHGVPGAFMSMIGYTLLNEIVNEKAKYTPAQVLEILHLTIRADLRQGYSGNNDGMDVCLCRLERVEGNKTEVLFAGAKRDLYCLSKNELKVIAGDRKSIGGSQREDYRYFKSQSIILEKGDRMYLTTDGLTDMAMGAKSRKSFGTRRFKSFIEKNIDMSLDDQYKLLAGLVEKYKAGTEQRDDILVLAIQLQ